jgi:membrane protein implicated in regulation of membrane protease activity
MLFKTVQQVKRFFLILFGLTLLLAGVVMLATPGPGWATIFAGLAVLAAAEVVWARRLLEKLKAQGRKISDAIRPEKNGGAEREASPPPADSAVSSQPASSRPR